MITPLRKIRKRKYFVIFAILLLFPFAASVMFGAPVKPSVTGRANLGDFPTQMPNGPTYRMAEQPYAYPTNRWWGSAYRDNQYGGYNASLYMSLGTSYLKFRNDFVGYEMMGAKPGLRSVAEVQGRSSSAGYLRLCVSSIPTTITYINPAPVTVTEFSDWGVTAVIRDTVNPDLKMTTTFVKGGIFVYSTFSPGTYPDMRLGWTRGAVDYRHTDGCAIISQGPSGSYEWFGVYVPEGTTYSVHDWSWAMGINLPDSAVNEEDRYVVVAYLGSQADYPTVNDVKPLFLEYRKYAYNFITDTKVSWNSEPDSSISTTFGITLAPPKRTGDDFVSGETLIAMYPHQWRYLTMDSQAIPNTNAPDVPSLRGKLKIYRGTSFKTNYEFHGMLPSLTYEIPETDTKIGSYLNTDKNFDIASMPASVNNTYRKGKMMAKVANLIPIFHQAGRIADRNTLIDRLKTELRTWFEGTGGHSLGYDATWGGIIGSPYRTSASIDNFGLELYNDHNFHYGYFVYASAIIAMFDPEFASDAQYKGIVDLLVKDYANSDRNDRSFPFLRVFDVYEGHSWSNGKGSTDAGDDGNDQESISEAMNAWAAVYLWGIATNNQEFIDTGMYGYVTESKAFEEYYFDIHDETYPSGFTHRGGILYDGSLKYRVHWEATGTTAQEKYGIWLLPMTPSMLYLGYDPAAAQSYYNKMLAEPANNNLSIWRDIFLRFKALYDAPGALSEWNSWNPSASAENEGSSLTFSYHFINFFNSLGTINTNYYAKDSSGNSVPFTVMENSNNERTFIAYNYSGSTKTVQFYPRVRSSVPNGGVMEIPPRVMAKTSDFQNFEYDLTSVSVIESTNTQRDVYSVFSDNFLGAIAEGNDYNDALSLDSWGNPSTIKFDGHASFSGSYEGENYLSAFRWSTATWGGWGFSFADGSAVDMSSYYGGEIEFSVRLAAPSTVAENFEAGVQTGAGNAVFTLKSLGFDQNSTEWQALSIPLNNTDHPYITADSLVYTTIPFFMQHNAGTSGTQWSAVVYIDSILWKKADTSKLFSLDLKNREDGTQISSITWTDSDFRDPNAVCSQFIEIDMTNVEGNTWALQIYTDNKHLVTDAGSSVSYDGTLSTESVSGLVCTEYPKREMLPMLWRAAPSTLSDDEVLNFEWMSTWMAFKDISSFDDTGLYKGHDYITIMNRKGFKYDQDASGALFGAPQGDKKIKLYFMADLRKALMTEYFANIIIEYFNE